MQAVVNLAVAGTLVVLGVGIEGAPEQIWVLVLEGNVHVLALPLLQGAHQPKHTTVIRLNHVHQPLTTPLTQLRVHVVAKSLREVLVEGIPCVADSRDAVDGTLALNAVDACVLRPNVHRGPLVILLVIAMLLALAVTLASQAQGEVGVLRTGCRGRGGHVHVDFELLTLLLAHIIIVGPLRLILVEKLEIGVVLALILIIRNTLPLEVPLSEDAPVFASIIAGVLLPIRAIEALLVSENGQARGTVLSAWASEAFLADGIIHLARLAARQACVLVSLVPKPIVGGAHL